MIKCTTLASLAVLGWHAALAQPVPPIQLDPALQDQPANDPAAAMHAKADAVARANLAAANASARQQAQDIARIQQQQMQAQLSAQASAQAAASSVPALDGGTTNAAAGKPPEGWPPIAKLPSPPVKLDHKEVATVKTATAWRNKKDAAIKDRFGVMRWVYGKSEPRLVCAPIAVCDITLQAGETVNGVRLGEPEAWEIKLAISTEPDGRTTHVSLRPSESGHNGSLLIYTDRRTYALRIASAEQDYIPRTGFTYPDVDTGNGQDMMSAYKAAVAGGAMKTGDSTMTFANSTMIDISHIEMLRIGGDNPGWRPLVAFTDGRKTYIQFSDEMQFSDGPVLLGINNDGGLFHSPTDRRVIYRWAGDKIVADTVMDKMALVLGVGSGQQRVTLTRVAKR